MNKYLVLFFLSFVLKSPVQAGIGSGCSAVLEITGNKISWYTKEGCRHLPERKHYLAAEQIAKELRSLSIVSLHMMVYENEEPFILNPKTNRDSRKVREKFFELIKELE